MGGVASLTGGVVSLVGGVAVEPHQSIEGVGRCVQQGAVVLQTEGEVPCRHFLFEGGEVPVDAEGRAEGGAVEGGAGAVCEEGAVVYVAQGLGPVGEVQMTIGGAGQTRGQTGTLEGVGTPPLEVRVTALLWEEGPGVELETPGHQVGGRLRQPCRQTDGQTARLVKQTDSLAQSRRKWN